MTSAGRRDAQDTRHFAGAPELAVDPRFLTNADRVRNRKAIYELLPDVTRKKTQTEWIEGLAKLGVPCSPVNNVDQVFADPQVRQRQMGISMPHPLSASGTVDLIGNPIKYSKTPVDYRLPPPYCGEHTDSVLAELLALPAAEIAALRQRGVV